MPDDGGGGLMMEANAIQVRIGELCHQFRLPTMGAQSVSRFTAAGHGDALETLLEVLEQEAEDRRQRRIGRLRTASEAAREIECAVWRGCVGWRASSRRSGAVCGGCGTG